MCRWKRWKNKEWDSYEVTADDEDVSIDERHMDGDHNAQSTVSTLAFVARLHRFRDTYECYTGDDLYNPLLATEGSLLGSIDWH